MVKVFKKISDPELIDIVKKKIKCLERWLQLTSYNHIMQAIMKNESIELICNF
jgi:hypothetical protein